MSVVLISRDLFFTSKVTGAADVAGVKVAVARDAEAVLTKMGELPVRCVFVDLADPALDVANLIARLPTENRPRVIAFGAHVATARLDAARAAGCDTVLTRGQFDAKLSELLLEYSSS